MTQRTTLTAEDGNSFEVAVAGRANAAHGTVIVLQEIFGLNAHIRNVVDRFAEAGYQAVGPALFDRAAPEVRLDYDQAGKERGIALKQAVDERALLDVKAAIRADFVTPPVMIVGFCWGGSLAWRAATGMDGTARAVSYYGGELPAMAGARARCPVMAHFGAHDKSIPMDGVNRFIEEQRDATPQVVCHVYDADHGFNCDARAQYDAAAAGLAWARTLEFLDGSR